MYRECRDAQEACNAVLGDQAQAGAAAASPADTAAAMASAAAARLFRELDNALESELASLEAALAQLEAAGAVCAAGGGGRVLRGLAVRLPNQAQLIPSLSLLLSAAHAPPRRRRLYQSALHPIPSSPLPRK